LVLPKDVIRLIASYLSGADVFQFLMTRQQWYTWFYSEDELWKTLFQGAIIKPPEPTDKLTWRERYSQLIQDGCIACGEFGNYFPFVGANVCMKCRHSELAYHLITKTETKRRYKLKDEDFKDLFCQMRGNGSYYLEAEVKEFSEAKKMGNTKPTTKKKGTKRTTTKKKTKETPRKKKKKVRFSENGLG